MIAAIIMANTLLEIMTFTVNFDDEFAGVRDEVRDIVAHGALSAKSEPRESICLQVAP
jgi:hypothetical protein